jgi:glycosyltransferase 2 family protein
LCNARSWAAASRGLVMTQSGTMADGVDRPQGMRLAAQSLGQRFLRPQTLLSFAFAALIVFFLIRRVDIHPIQVWGDVRSANVALVALALFTFYGGFMIRVVRWRQMLGQAGVTAIPTVRLPSNIGMLEIMLLSWFANCVVPAKLGDVYRGALLKRRSDAPFTTSMGTIAAERLIDLGLLLVLILPGAIVAFGLGFPSRIGNMTAYGGATVLAGMMAVGVMLAFRRKLIGYVPSRVADSIDRVQFGLFENLRRPWRSVGYSAVLWLTEGVRFFFVAWSLGTVLPPLTALVIALAGSLAAVWPFTPAGLGVVEVTLVYLLTLAGVSADTAAAIVVLERIVSYWSLIVVGLPLYVRHVRHDVAGLIKPVSPV